MPTLLRAKVAPIQSAPLVLTWTSQWSVYSPGFGILYSLFIHGIVLTVVVHLLTARHSTDPFQPLEPLTGSGVQMVMYLPSIGGGGQGGQGGLESAAEGPAAPSSGTKGLVFPGPQLVRADSPEPTNSVQTLLQPELEDLPNFVSMPDTGLVQRSEPPEPLVPPPDTAKSEEPELVKPPQPKPAPPPPVKVVELDFVEPRQPKPAPELADLPILERRVEVPDLAAIWGTGFVPPSRPADLAVELPDLSEPEEQLPLEVSDGAPIVPVSPELADLPILDRRADTPDFLSKQDVPLPDDVPEEEQPVEPVELADLPIFELRADAPDFLSKRDVPPPDNVPDEEAPSDDLATERVLQKLADLPMLQLRGDFPNSILSLTPVASRGELPAEIPAAQARGRFTISPEGSLDTTETEPGSPSAVESGDPAMGPGDENPGTDSFAAAITISFGSGGDGEGTTSGGGGDGGSGPGSASGQGSGSGPGSGTGSGPGSGAGSGPGGGPFAGITIVGGVGVGGETGTSGEGVDFGLGEGSLAGITIVGGVGGTVTPPSSVEDIRVGGLDPTNYGRLSVVSTESTAVVCPILVSFQMNRFVPFTWT